MPKPAPIGSTYVDAVWGYVMEKTASGWKRQHRLVMERKLGRKLKPWEVVRHKNSKRADNDPTNLELLSDYAHRSLHSKERRHSEATKRKMRDRALAIAADPEERFRRSVRAFLQHRKGE